MPVVQPISALYHSAKRGARAEQSYSAFRRGDFAAAHELADGEGMEEYREAVGAVLASAATQARALRELAGLTGDEVAARLGLARDTIYRRERGDRAAGADYLYALRWLLGHPREPDSHESTAEAA